MLYIKFKDERRIRIVIYWIWKTFCVVYKNKWNKNYGEIFPKYNMKIISKLFFYLKK